MTDWREADELGYLSSWLPMVRDDDRPVGDFHGAFLEQVAESLIVRLTEPGDWVWDCMAGSGTTGAVAERLGRKCLMTDINPVRDDVSYADARMVTPVFSEELASLVILHPPYHNIIRFSDKPEDLSNFHSISAFLFAFGEVCTNVGRHIKPGGYLGLVVGDVWVTRKQSAQTGDPYGCYPLGFRCMEVAMNSIPGSVLTAIQVKDITGHAAHRRGQENLWKSRLFRWSAVQFSHEYIMTVRKEGK